MDLRDPLKRAPKWAQGRTAERTNLILQTVYVLYTYIKSTEPYFTPLCFCNTWTLRYSQKQSCGTLKHRLYRRTMRPIKFQMLFPGQFFRTLVTDPFTALFCSQSEFTSRTKTEKNQIPSRWAFAVISYSFQQGDGYLWFYLVLGLNCWVTSVEFNFIRWWKKDMSNFLCF